MPKSEQPIPLQKLAFDSLVAHVVKCCDELSVAGFLTLLRQGIAEVKHHLRNYLPGILFAEFCRRFLDRFYSVGARRSENRPADHHRAVLEIMMDVEIVGLICEGRITRYLDHREAHRLQGLKVLDWTEPQCCESVARRLDNFRLHDLTTFVFPRMCTDPDLEIIGQRCFKLQVLRIEESENVTDKGLRALLPCSDLRIINLHCCPVSDDGVHELLNAHRKLEEFNVGNYYTIGEESFDVLSRPISMVCPSVKRFAMKSGPVTDARLRSVVAMFPNLTYLGFCCTVDGDLRILKSLKGLARLEFGYSSGGFSMENLKELLTSVGDNISQLALRSDVRVTQSDLNFIFKVCGSVENLHFGYEPREPEEKLVIPPFQKLKYLDCVSRSSRSDCHLVLEFCEMPNLESLRIQHFDHIFETTESLMLDDVKFPNLREVRTFHNYHDREIIDRIVLNARNKNLDFSLLSSQ